MEHNAAIWKRCAGAKLCLQSQICSHGNMCNVKVIPEWRFRGVQKDTRKHQRVLILQREVWWQKFQSSTVLSFWNKWNFAGIKTKIVDIPQHSSTVWSSKCILYCLLVSPLLSWKMTSRHVINCEQDVCVLWLSQTLHCEHGQNLHGTQKQLMTLSECACLAFLPKVIPLFCKDTVLISRNLLLPLCGEESRSRLFVASGYASATVRLETMHLGDAFPFGCYSSLMSHFRWHFSFVTGDGAFGRTTGNVLTN